MHKGGSGGGFGGDSYATVFILKNKHLKQIISYKYIKEVKKTSWGQRPLHWFEMSRRHTKSGDRI